jgi:GNAT superfamily N-acetyltransferase
MIRDRQEGDLDPCLALLSVVHAADGYPMHWPADPYRWLNPRGMRQAWVAIGRLSAGAEGIVGHVLVRDDRLGGDPSAAELGRLFVHPGVRRQGVAAQLLDHARDWAARSGLTLVLEVAAAGRSAAMDLYQATGWRHVDTVTADWTGPAGEPVRLHRYRDTRHASTGEPVSRGDRLDVG